MFSQPTAAEYEAAIATYETLGTDARKAIHANLTSIANGMVGSPKVGAAVARAYVDMVAKLAPAAAMENARRDVWYYTYATWMWVKDSTHPDEHSAARRASAISFMYPGGTKVTAATPYDRGTQSTVAGER
jgi:hypothetical protein